MAGSCFTSTARLSVCNRQVQLECWRYCVRIASRSGELKLGYLSGYVYEDDNDNGVKDPGEKGIANVTVELYVLQGEEYQAEIFLAAIDILLNLQTTI